MYTVKMIKHCIQREWQILWKVNNLWLWKGKWHSLYYCCNLLVNLKLFLNLKKLKKLMEVLELKYIKTKIENWIWLRGDYIPVKSKLMNWKTDQKKISSINREKRTERECKKHRWYACGLSKHITGVLGRKEREKMKK